MNICLEIFFQAKKQLLRLLPTAKIIPLISFNFKFLKKPLFQKRRWSCDFPPISPYVRTDGGEGAYTDVRTKVFPYPWCSDHDVLLEKVKQHYARSMTETTPSAHVGFADEFLNVPTID